MNPRKNLLNRRFGLLTVIAFAGKNAYHNTLWMCECDCGAIKDRVLYQNLVNGRTTSCGCTPRGPAPKR